MLSGLSQRLLIHYAFIHSAILRVLHEEGATLTLIAGQCMMKANFPTGKRELQECP